MKASLPGRIAIYGGSFSPPGIHHTKVVEAVAARFQQVVVVPCGPRPDRPELDDTEPIYRAALADMAFGPIDRVKVELFDLEQATFTRTHALEARFANRGEVWHVVGSDLVAGGARGESLIHRSWEHGKRLWTESRFVVVSRPGHPFDAADLPPNHELIELDIDGSSTEIRERRFHSEPIDDLVPPDIADYISRHRLYRGRISARVSRLSLDEPRLLIVHDERNPRAVQWRKELEQYESADSPNCIVVLGGDGSMLRAIQQHWRLRLPFLGINAGRLGFLLNERDQVLDNGFPPSELILRQMPLLYIETQHPDGSIRVDLCFNDAWVERATGQSAWLEVKIDDRVRLSRLICDGVLLSTAAGSTAYARAMGATPLLADTPAWLIVGNNVLQPIHWKSALLSPESTVELRVLDTDKRPLKSFVYGEPRGEVEYMRARISRIAAAELAFVAQHDMAEKIARIQFPQVGSDE